MPKFAKDSSNVYQLILVLKEFSSLSIVSLPHSKNVSVFKINYM